MKYLLFSVGLAALISVSLPTKAQNQILPPSGGGGGCITLGTTEVCSGNTATSIVGLTVNGVILAGSGTFNIGAGGTLGTAAFKNTGTSGNTVPLLDGANTWSAGQTITPPVNTTPLTVSGYSLTGSNAQSLVDLSGTWNTSSSPIGIKLNITNTASGINSALMDLQVNGSSLFKVLPSGVINSPYAAFSGYAIAPSFFNQSDVGGYYLGASSNVALRWDGAGIPAFRNGTSAQELRVYRDLTDASNYSYATIDAGKGTANTLVLGSRKTGSPGAALTKLSVEVDGTSRLDYGMTTAGAWSFPSGSAGSPSLIFGSTNDGLYSPATGQVAWTTGGIPKFVTLSSIFKAASDGRIVWSDNADATAGSVDTGLTRTAAGEISAGTGGAGSAAGTLRAAAYKVGATAGADCSGSPTAGFAVVKGIVTAC